MTAKNKNMTHTLTVNNYAYRIYSTNISRNPVRNIINTFKS
jgi:hypothetical protein